ncbi:MAG: ABC transporter ATP-binding protein, partial [Tissierellia bacterium]|nr:ABC transporter ATP-binding protein [Tissierellia bacterium]
MMKPVVKMRHRGPMGGFRHTSTVDQPADLNFKQSWIRLVRYSKQYLPSIAIALFIASLGTVFQIIGPNQMKILADEIAKGLPQMINGMPMMGAIDFSAVSRVAWLLVFLLSTAGVLSLIEHVIMATVSARISQRLRSGVSAKINR